jgi:hypothetical protein
VLEMLPPPRTVPPLFFSTEGAAPLPLAATIGIIKLLSNIKNKIYFPFSFL